jgi:hypothetical protein
MPSNIEHANISAIKLGTADVASGYIGHEQVYPNGREIASGVYTSTSQVPGNASGQIRTFSVTGEVGAEYSLNVTTRVSNAASINGNYTLTSPTKNHNLSFNDAGCGSGVINIAYMTLTPTGLTSIAGGASTITANLTQGAGDPIYNWSPTFTWTITNTNRVVVVQNGVTKWAQGSTFDFRVQSNNTPSNPYPFGSWYYTANMFYVISNQSGTVHGQQAPASYGPKYIDTGTVSGTFNSAIPQASFQPKINVGGLGCATVNNQNYPQFLGPTIYP